MGPQTVKMLWVRIAYVTIEPGSHCWKENIATVPIQDASYIAMIA